MSTEKILLEKKILVVGGSGGIGSKICEIFYKSGWKVSNLSRNSVKNGGKYNNYQVDIKRASQVTEVFKVIEKEVGSLDAVVNCSGVIQDALLTKMEESAWDEVIGVNLSGALFITQQAARLLEKAGGGHLIHFGSVSGVTGRRGQTNYAAAKAGLIALVKSAAKELGEKNIRVNAIIPGFLRTPMTAKISAEQEEQIRRDNALGRIGTAEEVARFVYFLCTTENISGQVFNLDSRVLPYSV